QAICKCSRWHPPALQLFIACQADLERTSFDINRAVFERQAFELRNLRRICYQGIATAHKENVLHLCHELFIRHGIIKMACDHFVLPSPLAANTASRNIIEELFVVLASTAQSLIEVERLELL